MSTRKNSTLKFQQKSSRPRLSREECGYWLDYLPRVLKIGTEFEINLPEPTAALHSPDSLQCIHSCNSCIEDCTNLESCLIERHPTFCKTRKTGFFLNKKFECLAKDDSDTQTCKKCEGWFLNCRRSSCASYVPYCTICPSFTRIGAKAIENADIRQDAESVRKEVKRLLQPTGFVGQMGQHGVLEVKKDNSLRHNGGIEVPTIGRRVHWASFYNMCREIIEPIAARGGFVDERCGQHYHILAGYFQKGIGAKISDLERSIPEIVLANLHQLHRRYELAMFWMMSAGSSPDHLTRWARFRQPIYHYSALRNKMPKVQKELADNIVCMSGTPQNGKYASVAYHFCKFDDAGDVETFHIENRIADSTLSPAVVTAHAMLCYALVMKAVRLSQYGIMEVGDGDFVYNTKEASRYLINGQERDWSGSRLGDTSGVGPWIPFLQETSRELVQLLKSELHNLGPAYNILMDLAERPCSIRRVAGDSWEKIEEDLYGIHVNPNQDLVTVGEDSIRELVDLAGIVDCDNIEMWVEEVAANLGQPPALVAGVTQDMVSSGQYRWSDAIGSLITT